MGDREYGAADTEFGYNFGSCFFFLEWDFGLVFAFFFSIIF